MEFSLNEKELAALKEWQEKIKDLFGEYGLYTYKFMPTGIGTAITVYSHNTKTELDLTDLDSW
jgi:hypothetical protein